MDGVHRTTRVALRVTRGQARRCFGLLRAAGDVWAAMIEVNAHRFARGSRPIGSYQEWCREIAGVTCGELSVPAIRSVVRRYSSAFFEAARRRKRGDRARYPRRKKALFPVRWHRHTFALEGRRLRLSMAKGRPELWVRLAREIPYSAEWIRSVTLVCETGRLFVDVTAAVPIAEHDLDPTLTAGVDVGIIHPFAVVSGDEALLVSGRAIRAENRLHLADSKARASKIGRKVPRRGQRGSRRWRKLRAAQRKAGTRHRRRVNRGQHQAAKAVIDWAVDLRIGTIAIGDLTGITARRIGRHQNLRLRQWRRTHLVGALRDKAEAAGIRVVFVDERGTSSTCPQCNTRTTSPRGRVFECPSCGHHEHRDIASARNIAARSGGTTRTPVRVTHRRVGQVPARRDRRRHLWDRRRSSPAPGRSAKAGSRSLVNQPRSTASEVVHDHPDGPPVRITQAA